MVGNGEGVMCLCVCSCCVSECVCGLCGIESEFVVKFSDACCISFGIWCKLVQLATIFFKYIALKFNYFKQYFMINFISYSCFTL